MYDLQILKYFLVLLSPIFGSFIGAFSYRYPRNISINNGRSICPNCKKQINWYDNIPVLSFFFLLGKCRWCGKKISYRYPVIEMSALIISILLLIFLNQVNFGQFLVFYILSFTFLTIAVIDLEHQIIPDSLVWIATVAMAVFLLPSGQLYMSLFSGFLASAVLYGLNIVTGGRGMGLGDVKLAIPIGMAMGFPGALFTLFYSFFVGAVVGIILIFLGNAKLKDKIAFGPFMIIGFFLSIIIGEAIQNVFGF